ncbi:hypothetical protein G9A89_022711 [Geosiphon pyriformis]|nr:hypothetical protein G9A89_022711 [Geosiphon pyriformis]
MTNTAMFLDKFKLTKKFSDLDVMAFKKKWFKSYNGMFTKKFSKLHNLKILVLRIVKAFHKVDSGQFLAELLRAKKSGIKSAIKKKIENFVVNKGHTIHSVLECPFHKVVLDHLVSDSNLILDPHQYLPLDYVNDDAFSGVMDAISLDDLTCVVKNLPDGKAAGLSGISNELWKHCNGSILSLLLDLLNICLVCELPYEWKGILTNTRLIILIETAHKIFSKLLFDRILSACCLFNILHGNNFSVLKSTTTQSLIFAIGSVIKDALEKDCELWLVLQDMHKVYNSVDWHHLCNSLVQIKMCKYFIRFFGSIHNNHVNHIMINFSLTDRYWIHNGFDQDRMENQDSLTSFLAAGIFVDDTIWMVGNALLSISGLLISVACKKKFHQYLGIYLSFESLFKPSLAKTYVDIRFFINLVLKKTILDKQFLYLISAVLQLITLYHSFLYSLKSFEQLQTKYKVASVLCFSNASGVFGRLFNHSPVNNFLVDIIRIFLDCKMSFGNLSVIAFCFSGRTPMSTVLRISLFYDVSSSFKRSGVIFAKQLYTKKNLVLNWKSFRHWKRLDLRGPVPHWFTLACGFLECSSPFDDLCIVGLQALNVYSSGDVSSLDRLLRNLGSLEIKCGAAAYFPNLNLSISARAIALALECVPLDSSVVVYSNSQTALDACVAESALIEQCNIVNLIKEKWLNVSWHKVKGHSGVVGNERANNLASLAVGSDLALPVLVKERFIKAGRMAVSENICYFAHKIFRFVNHACWEIGSGFDVIDNSLLDDVNWSYSTLMWHPDFYMMAGFTSKSTASLYSYFLKTLYCHLPVAVWKHLYSKVYPSVLCLCCGDVKSSDYFFVYMFDSDIQEAMFILDNAKTAGKFIVDFVRELGAAHHTDIWLFVMYVLSWSD